MHGQVSAASSGNGWRAGGAPKWSFADRLVAITRTDGFRGGAQKVAFEAAGATVIDLVDSPDESTVERQAAQIEDGHGKGLDALVVNGAPVDPQALVEMAEETWDGVIAEHVTGPFLLFKHVVPLMGEGTLGKVVVTAGPETWSGSDGLVHLTAARHAVFGLAKDLALETRARKINVNVSCPSTAVDDAGAEDHEAALAALTQSVMWLSSDASRFVTATSIRLQRPTAYAVKNRTSER